MVAAKTIRRERLMEIFPIEKDMVATPDSDPDNRLTREEPILKSHR